MMTTQEILKKVCDALEEKQAKNIKTLKVDELTIIAEYFVICTGTSGVHLRTLSDTIEKMMKDAGEPPRHIEGYRSGNWILVDLGCVTVHIFSEEARDFYNLERLWNDAETKIEKLDRSLIDAEN